MKFVQVRQSFLDFFQKNGHIVVDSGPIVLEPTNDLLFANAGMVQFKDIFVGTREKFASRVATSQYCLRAGGKHNDLENVGFTTRHHTFFEMLGNFSFGDYFKEDAIKFAWEYITKVLAIPKERLYITVYKGDTTSADLWRKCASIKRSNLILKGYKDNFWTMGDVGPCGFCSELFYDRGPEYTSIDRYVELWNLVFIEYIKTYTGTMEKLSTSYIDTGMGLERVTSVVQGVYDNYLIDVFEFLIQDFSHFLRSFDRKSSLRVLADHARACLFLITVGLQPSSTGAGYVLRRIIRRSIYHIMCFGDFYFYDLVPRAIPILEKVYPNVLFKKNLVVAVLKNEEEKFRKTLQSGIDVLNRYLNKTYVNVVSGKMLFKLYDTYGFPISFINDIVHDKNIIVDIRGFRYEFLKHKEKSKNLT